MRNFFIFLSVVALSLNSFAANMTSASQNEMQTLTQLEMQNPELQNQIAGKCWQEWDSNVGEYRSVCRTPIQGAVAWGLIGLLLGSLGGSGAMVAGTAIGAVFGYVEESD